MERYLKLSLCLLLAGILLCSCASNQPAVVDVPNITQALGPTDTPAPVTYDNQSYGTDESVYTDQGYTEADAYEEENYGESESVFDSSNYYASSAVTVYPFAGATPIPLDPIDKPTATPRPKLGFTLASYTSAMLGITLNAPVGWQISENSGILILSEPSSEAKDGQACMITISAEPVGTNYSENNLKTYVKQRLESLYSSSYSDWDNSLTASRHMMGSAGVYANYSATKDGSVKIGGRILYTCINKTLYGLEIVYPYGFKDDFITLFNDVRSSMTLN